jgi:hypothetical protein
LLFTSKELTGKIQLQKPTDEEAEENVMFLDKRSKWDL